MKYRLDKLPRGHERVVGYFLKGRSLRLHATTAVLQLLAGSVENISSSRETDFSARDSENHKNRAVFCIITSVSLRFPPVLHVGGGTTTVRRIRGVP